MKNNESTLAIIIPALNEAKTIGDVISRIPKAIPAVEEVKVIVVNDGSTDSTADIAKSMGAKVVTHQNPKGVGAAFHSGIKAALLTGADIIVNIDADGQFNPADIPKLLAPIQEEKADFVTATRFAQEDFIPEMPAIKKWGNKRVVQMVNMLTGKKFTDVSCGFRAYSREAALKLTLFGNFTYTQESLIDLAFKGMRIAEVPLKVRGVREHGNSRVASNLWRYAAKSASIMLLTGRDYKPFYFFGLPGIGVFLLGVLSGIFVLQHYLATGQTSPFRSLVTLSGTFIIVGSLLLFISMLADMTHRNRVLIEEQLYLRRKQIYSKGKK